MYWSAASVCFLDVFYDVFHCFWFTLAHSTLVNGSLFDNVFTVVASV